MTRFFCTFRFPFIILFTALLNLPPITASPGNKLLLILDASGSMWQKVNGEFKIAIARQVLKNLVAELPADTEVGLVAYGHRRKGDCDDIETIVPLGPLDQAALGQLIDGLDPKGKTPITNAIKTAFETARSQEEETTIVLISDGIETCGGDPCATVRGAKAAGLNIIMHVIGFDVGKVDISQLECSAQAGGGLYFSANNAEELADALKQTTTPTEVPPGRISIKAIADGKLTDVGVHVLDSKTGKKVAFGRTYTSPKTNPRILPVPAGTYDIDVRALSFKGNVRRSFKGIEITSDAIVEKVVDFSSGQIAIEVTRKGNLSDAVVHVYEAGTRKSVARGRTYTSSNSNPKVFQLTPGEYDVVIGSVEISGKPEHRFDGILVESGAKAKRSHDFASGTLRVGAGYNGELVDCVVVCYSKATGKHVAKGRTYTSANSNPKSFVLPPGSYKIDIRSVRLEGKPSRQIEVNVEAGQTVEQMVDLSTL